MAAEKPLDWTVGRRAAAFDSTASLGRLMPAAAAREARRFHPGAPR